MADLTGHVSFVSRRLVELHGAETADEFLGKTAWDYMVPEDHEKYRQYFQKTLKDGITSDVEYTFIREGWNTLSCRIIRCFSQRCRWKAGGNHKRPERHHRTQNRPKEALRGSEQRFRSYFEQGLMGMAVSKGGTHWTEVNDRFCDILGYSREEVVQRKGTDLYPS